MFSRFESLTKAPVSTIFQKKKNRAKRIKVPRCNPFQFVKITHTRTPCGALGPIPQPLVSVGYLILELPILVPPRDFHLDPRGRGQTRKRMKGQHARGLGKGGKKKKVSITASPTIPLAYRSAPRVNQPPPMIPRSTHERAPLGLLRSVGCQSPARGWGGRRAEATSGAGAVVARGGGVGAVAAAHAPDANDGATMSRVLSHGGHQAHHPPPLHRSGCANRTRGWRWAQTWIGTRCCLPRNGGCVRHCLHRSPSRVFRHNLSRSVHCTGARPARA